MNWTTVILGATTTAAVGVLVGELPVPDLSNLTATAILGWYAWHTASRTIPGLLADFRAELAAKRAECRADRDAFRQEMGEERVQRHADNLVIVQALQELKGRAGEHRKEQRTQRGRSEATAVPQGEKGSR